MTKKYLVPAAFLLVILALGYSVYRRAKSTSKGSPQADSQRKEEPKPPVSEESMTALKPHSPTDEPEPPIVDGWKTYESNELGFKIRYPGSWYHAGRTDIRWGTNVMAFSNIKDEGEYFKNLGETDVDLEIIVIKDYPYQTLERIRKSADNSSTQVKEVDFQGLPAVERRDSKVFMPLDGRSLSIEFARGNYFYCLALFSKTEEGIKKQETTFRQMLDTFAFTGQPLEYQPEEWVTYGAYSFGYKFRYPKGWYDCSYFSEGDASKGSKCISPFDFSPYFMDRGVGYGPAPQISVGVSEGQPRESAGEEGPQGPAGIFYVGKTTLGGLPAREEIQIYEGAARRIICTKGNKTYTISLEAPLWEDFYTYKELFEEIVKTFEFYDKL